MKFIIIVLVVVFILSFISSLITKFQNKYKLSIHIGKKGSGKTCYLQYLACKYHDDKNISYIFCTERGIKYTTYIDYSIIGRVWFPDNSVILIDEAALLWHNRNYSDKQYNIDFKAVREWLKYQRHNHVIVHMFTQSMDLDKNIRDLADNIYIHSAIGPIGFIKEVGRKISLGSDTATSNAIGEEFYYIHGTKFLYFPKYTKLYDSFSRLPLRDFNPAIDLPATAPSGSAAGGEGKKMPDMSNNC